VKDVDNESQRSVKIPDDTCRLEEKLERTVRCSSVLIGALGLSLAALAIYTAVLAISEYRAPRPCLTEECVSTASRILQSLNKEVEPCTDFYEFACGGWIKRNPVPEWATSWDQLALLRERLVSDLRDLLEEPDQPHLPESVRKAKTLYRTCIDVDKLEKDGIEPIQRVLVSLGLPPRPPSKNGTAAGSSRNETIEKNAEDEEGATNSSGWASVAGHARRMLGISVLVSVQVAEDVRNTSRNRLVVEQVSPGFSERYLLQAAQFAHEVGQYRAYVRDVVRLADARADADGFADDVVEFSTSLAKIMTPVEVRRSGTHLFHEVSVRQLLRGSSGGPAQWHDHNWELYLSLVFANTSVTLQDDDRVIVMDLPYLQRLAVLLSESDPLVIGKGYFVMQTLNKLM
ncbi:hypothetical protein ACJJTC_011248, partial [Scirpophaga incertulas]